MTTNKTVTTTPKEAGKVLLREDLQKALLNAKQIVDYRKLTHWCRG